MIYKVLVSQKANEDLKELYEYIAFVLLSPHNASGQLDRLEGGIMSLAHMPMRFKKYDSEPWQSRGMRMMIVDNFAVMYIPDEKNCTVTVVRVIYAGRDIDKEL